MIELAVDNININSFFTRWAHPNQHLHERAGCGQHQQLYHQVPIPVLEEGSHDLKVLAMLD